MKKIFRLLIMLITLSFLVADLQAQNVSKDKWTTKKAIKWFKKKDWLNGLPMEPHTSINVQEFAWQYHQYQKYWDEAFAFLKTHDLKTLAKGKYPIDSNFVYASVTEDPSKDFDKTSWESHRKYIDLQYVIDGEEKMGIFPAAKAQVIKPYDENKDVANYVADGPTYSATPEAFFIFFPTDAHRPNITPGGNKVVKKIVIKVKAAE